MLLRSAALGAASGLVTLTFTAAKSVAAEPTETECGFSIVALGDDRPMMYLPYKQGQAEIEKLLVEMFELVLPQEVAKEVVRRDAKLTFDPVTKDLIQIDMPLGRERYQLKLDAGWVTECSVEGIKRFAGVRTTIFHLYGGAWVGREAVHQVRSGRAKFIVDTGDVVWWGGQGRAVDKSPYWKRFNDTLLSQLPPPDDEMRAAGLKGRYFLSVGNHEVWGDPEIQGLLSAVPYLREFGVTPERLIYTFDFGGVRFVFLWSGKYDYRSPSLWDADRPKYAAQMQQMQQWLDEAKSKGIRKAFIFFHYPVFARSGLGPIPERDNPHKIIAQYGKDMEVIVFNGHVHTTEIYEADGVKYLMLGGGGAEQDPILPGHSRIKVAADYPPDLYWKGAPREEEYNYTLVDVQPGKETKFTLNRFRPGSADPFATVELFK